MKIFVITGSPRKSGNSDTIADEFIKGAKEKGHEVIKFEAASKNVHPCVACDSCKPSCQCVFKDDFDTVKNDIADANMIVFASPMYYFGISAQIKAVIDRFYSIDSKLRNSSKKAALILTYADNTIKTAQPVIEQYKAILGYLGWSNEGEIIAPSLWEKDDVKNTDFLTKAYEFGKSL